VFLYVVSLHSFARIKKQRKRKASGKPTLVGQEILDGDKRNLKNMNSLKTLKRNCTWGGDGIPTWANLKKKKNIIKGFKRVGWIIVNG